MYDVVQEGEEEREVVPRGKIQLQVSRMCPWAGWGGGKEREAMKDGLAFHTLVKGSADWSIRCVSDFVMDGGGSGRGVQSNGLLAEG